MAVGIGGGLYHSQSVEAFFAHVPGLKVVIPSNPYDAKGLLKAAVRDPNPVIFLEPKKGYRLIKGEVPEDEEIIIPIGPAKVEPGGRSRPERLCLWHDAPLRAGGPPRWWPRKGIDVEVVDLRTLYPVDRETILQSIRKTSKALIVHEDNLTGGYGAEIAATIAEWGFMDLDARGEKGWPGRTCRVCRSVTPCRNGSWSTPKRSPRRFGNWPRFRVKAN